MIVTFRLSAPAHRDGRRRRTAAPCLLLLTALLCTGNAVAADPPPVSDAQFRAIATAAVNRIMRPAFDSFAIYAEALNSETRALCSARVEGANEATEQALQPIFADAVAAFSVIEFLRIGPLLEDNRLNRLFYWPDRRAAGERQLRELLADTDGSMSARAMADRSVAVQGLPALERLLYPDRDTAAAATRCDAAIGVAGNIANMADAMRRDWTDDRGISREMIDPRDTDELLRTPDEVMRRLLTQVVAGLEIVIDQKLAPALEHDPARLTGLPFVRSGTFHLNLANNVATLRALALDTGMAEAGGLQKELAFEFRNVDGYLTRLSAAAPVSPPWPATLDEDTTGVLRAMASVLSSIRDTVNERLSPNLGIKTGFNASDGD